MFLLLIVGVTLFATFVALVGRALALPRLRALDHLGKLDAYGFSVHPDEPEPSRALAGALDHLAKLLGSFFSGRLRGLSEEETRRELMAAGMYRTSPVTLVGYRVISALSFPTIGLWLVTSAHLGGAMAILAILLSFAFGWVAPMTVVRRRARRRLVQIDDELPELVDLLVVTVESGMGLAGSLQLAASRSSGPLSDELRLALQEQTMGLPTDQVLANILTRSDTPALRSFVRSIRQGEALGVSIGAIMRNLAIEMRKRRFASAEERAQKAPVKMLFPLVALIFPALFIVLLAPAIMSFTSSLGGGS
jgi:tight adherence protein C